MSDGHHCHYCRKAECICDDQTAIDAEFKARHPLTFKEQESLQAEVARLTELLEETEAGSRVNAEQWLKFKGELKQERRAKEQTVSHYQGIQASLLAQLNQIFTFFGVKEPHEVCLKLEQERHEVCLKLEQERLHSERLEAALAIYCPEHMLLSEHERRSK